MRRADGYYVQFCVSVDNQQQAPATKSEIGIDVGLEYFYTRTHSCPHCGHIEQRDVNAAKVILTRANEQFGGGFPSERNCGATGGVSRRF